MHEQDAQNQVETPIHEHEPAGKRPGLTHEQNKERGDKRGEKQDREQDLEVVEALGALGLIEHRRR